MICPVCMATAAVTITSATSAGGGFAALVMKIFRKKNTATQLTAFSTAFAKERNHVDE